LVFGGSVAERYTSSGRRPPEPALAVLTSMIAQSETSPQRRYRLIAEIGRGGMAEVYLAVAQGPGGFNKLVVVKKSLRDLALQPEILSMFIDEARLAARMNHPNVVQTYELGEEGGRHFIAMEYLDGQPYSRVLTRLRNQPGGLDAMSLAHHLRVLADTLAGLHHAHELKDFDGTPLYVVHRDVSPQNVFVTYDGSVKVVDFGIAKAQDSSSRTVTGEIKGKVTYMSPEQMRGEPLDRRSDVFAVGVMLWEAVAGRRMWKDLPDARIVGDLLLGQIPSIREAVPNVPAELEHILLRALHPDREARYPSALAMQRELEAYAMASGARVDGPEVGRVVSEYFGEERQRVREIVEAQLGSLRWTGENPAATNLPTIPSAPGSMPGRDWPGSDMHAASTAPDRSARSPACRRTAALRCRCPHPRIDVRLCFRCSGWRSPRCSAARSRSASFVLRARRLNETLRRGRRQSSARRLLPRRPLRSPSRCRSRSARTHPKRRSSSTASCSARAPSTAGWFTARASAYCASKPTATRRKRRSSVSPPT
jgi:eukaryotic-like serine/threonine-protein kinase